jgi:hypothetical protein
LKHANKPRMPAQRQTADTRAKPRTTKTKPKHRAAKAP